MKSRRESRLLNPPPGVRTPNASRALAAFAAAIAPLDALAEARARDEADEAEAEAAALAA